MSEIADIPNDTEANTTSGKIFEKAGDPHQYDREDVIWDATLGNDPLRRCYWNYVKATLPKWNEYDLLEIGSGTGWLLDEAIRSGVRSAVGIEPSQKNVEQARILFPHVPINLTSLEDFRPNRRFNRVVALAVFGHIKDLEGAFKKISDLMTDDGEVLITVPGYDFFSKDDLFGGESVREKINDNEFAVTRKDFGSNAHIVRKTEVLQEAAEKAGLKLAQVIPMVPTQALMQEIPYYKKVEGVALNTLLRFQRK